MGRKLILSLFSGIIIVTEIGEMILKIRKNLNKRVSCCYVDCKGDKGLRNMIRKEAVFPKTGDF